MSDDEPEASIEVSADGQPEVEGNGVCFVIAPIDSDDSDTRQRTEDLLSYVIEPVVDNGFGLDVEVAHHIDEPGNITRQVMEFLFEADLVIADLTEHNPNVMYELAVRHATGLPVVTIALDGTKLPFDIGPQRTKFYELGFGGAEDFKVKLKAAVEEALSEEHEPDNPIQQVREGFTLDKVLEGKFEQLAGEGENGVAGILKQLLTRIESLESQIRNQRSLRSAWSQAARAALAGNGGSSSRMSEDSRLREILTSPSSTTESKYTLRGNPEDIGLHFEKEEFPHALTPIASDVEQSRIVQVEEEARNAKLIVEHDADEKVLDAVVAKAADAAGIEIINVHHGTN
jgi:hypothetical protein